MEKASIILKEKDICKRIDSLASEINKDYAGKSLIVLCILNGAFMFTSDLVKKINVPIEVDFISLCSYNGTESSEEITVDFTSKVSLKNKHILIVDDIVDTGLTAKYLLGEIEARNPASIKICALLDKPSRRKKLDVNVDYIGFTIDDIFVIGYGMDYEGDFRNLTDIYHYKPKEESWT